MKFNNESESNEKPFSKKNFVLFIGNRCHKSVEYFCNISILLNANLPVLYRYEVFWSMRRLGVCPKYYTATVILIDFFFNLKMLASILWSVMYIQEDHVCLFMHYDLLFHMHTCWKKAIPMAVIHVSLSMSSVSMPMIILFCIVQLE